MDRPRIFAEALRRAGEPENMVSKCGEIAQSLTCADLRGSVRALGEHCQLARGLDCERGKQSTTTEAIIAAKVQGSLRNGTWRKTQPLTPDPPPYSIFYHHGLKGISISSTSQSRLSRHDQVITRTRRQHRHATGTRSSHEVEGTLR